MITLTYNNDYQYCDWFMSNDGQLNLETEILVALGTDRIAEDTWTGADKKGWCLDPSFGSRLWELKEMSYENGTYESKANSFVKESLQYLITNEVCKDIDVSSTYDSGRLTIMITITKNNSEKEDYQYEWGTN
ncbi:phage GP46 family protein [Novacetimonas hansenii]|uniref:Uncharacterized protein n=1 Tax=Novacetimonas hansenii TaxID=436 RepID=A0ABQ0SH39_NOVHA|nr:phage GP46 family protein [Novacetimonas hansenii]GAN84016.1 hypothetical protein Gaha_0122_016 [Novacetimonas hansenii JCM 7643]GBQ55765.1 hypothetical protein AA0243_1004 [Novacetimonas hansenii NRIC 0243]GEC64596.1 hypothetical protein GHA01_24450 [Novacetimonas hansenii]